MGWYDVFRNTKINYFLVPVSFAIGPLIYFYIKSFIEREFAFDKKKLLHFLPTAIYTIYKINVYIYDRSQPGFSETQNGVFMQSDLYYGIDVFYVIVVSIQMFLYLALSIYVYYQYRNALVQQYSNTYKSELHWLRNFLFVYSFLFVYDVLQTVTDEFIFNLGWTGRWWYQFLSVIIVIYVGLKGFFTDMNTLKKIDLSIIPTSKKAKNGAIEFDRIKELEKMQYVVSTEKLYLDPNLSLTQLSKAVRMSPTLVSDLINRGLGKNFNDYINRYRVKTIVSRLSDENYSHLSILSIALDNGFNSKATFNRVFKKITGKSPSEYRK